MIVKYINETLEDKINRRLDEANQARKLAKKQESYETKRARRLRKIEKGWVAYRSKT